MNTIIDKEKTYEIAEAIKLAKETCKTKFDSTLEVHFNLGIDHKKPEQCIRVSTTLPHGTGKTKKVAVFASKKCPGADIELSEDDLGKIEKGTIKPKVDFDVVIAEPRYMAKLAKIARILGPAGMMPNPKSGTVTEDVEKAVEQVKKGKVELRNEPDAPIIHSIFGKKSFENDKLAENFQEILNTLKSNRPQKVKPDHYIKSCFITTTMGPSVQVQVQS